MTDTIEILGKNVELRTVKDQELDVDHAYGDTCSPARDETSIERRVKSLEALKETLTEKPDALTFTRAYIVDYGFYVFGHAEKYITHQQLLSACASAYGAPNAGGHVLRNLSGKFEVFVFSGRGEYHD